MDAQIPVFGGSVFDRFKNDYEGKFPSILATRCYAKIEAITFSSRYDWKSPFGYRAKLEETVTKRPVAILGL